MTMRKNDGTPPSAFCWRGHRFGAAPGASAASYHLRKGICREHGTTFPARYGATPPQNDYLPFRSLMYVLVGADTDTAIWTLHLLVATL